jgi:hypothetical protein
LYSPVTLSATFGAFSFVSFIVFETVFFAAVASFCAAFEVSVAFAAVFVASAFTPAAFVLAALSAVFVAFAA